MALLEVSDLEAGYGGMGVLSGLSFELGEHEKLAVLGRNGIGKTTLLRTLMGLHPLTAGRIAFQGHDVSRVATHRRPGLGIGYVPQGRRLFPRLSVEENLAVGAKSSRTGQEERLAAVFAMFPKLAERRSQLAGTLSGGEQQMTAVGRALMVGPKLLLLDEPSEGLAPIIVERLVDEIAAASAAWGFAVVIVEQNVEAALRCADRALIIDQGRVAVDTSSEEMRQRPDLTDVLSF
jgi:ABC-type branched-subunit amino acid transport system ATPase component